jgi:hypothetical protein
MVSVQNVGQPSIKEPKIPVQQLERFQPQQGRGTLILPVGPEEVQSFTV